jgi:hypothetical protein
MLQILDLTFFVLATTINELTLQKISFRRLGKASLLLTI